MRNFILVCVVALLAAVGVAYAVGFVDFTYEHRDGKCLVTTIINTAMLRHEASSAGAALENEPVGDNAIDVKGKVTAVRPEKNELTVSENVKSWTFELAKGAKVSINDRDSKLSEVQPGDDAIVTFDRDGQKLIANAVHCKRK